jgi:hypothetical protein
MVVITTITEDQFTFERTMKAYTPILTPGVGTDRLSGNVGNKLPVLAAQ